MTKKIKLAINSGYTQLVKKIQSELSELDFSLTFGKGCLWLSPKTALTYMVYFIKCCVNLDKKICKRCHL